MLLHFLCQKPLYGRNQWDDCDYKEDFLKMDIRLPVSYSQKAWDQGCNSPKLPLKMITSDIYSIFIAQLIGNFKEVIYFVTLSVFWIERDLNQIIKKFN